MGEIHHTKHSPCSRLDPKSTTVMNVEIGYGNGFESGYGIKPGDR